MYILYFLLFGAVTIFLSTELGKNGLKKNFKYVPNYLMAGYIASFILTAIALETLSVYRFSLYGIKCTITFYALILNLNEQGICIVSASVVPLTTLNGPKVSTTISGPSEDICEAVKRKVKVFIFF